MDEEFSERERMSITRRQRAASGSQSPGPTSTSIGRTRTYKRLIVCCDGTWLDQDSSLQSDGKLVPPSNVTRITRAIRSKSSDGIQQIVYYQAGVGSMGTIGNKIVGGALGQGIPEHVREAYSFIANNYDIGDEIFLLGFSRGAFTARSVGGLIGFIGLMTKAGLPSFPVVYKDWTQRHNKRYRSPSNDIPFPNKPPSIEDPRYVSEMERRGLTILGVRIKAIGVWDTVGALGVPRMSWLGRWGQSTITDFNEYAFYDTTLDECIDNAFQALGLDEKRAAFSPSLWEKRNNKITTLIQVWFPGVHANVGGGYNDQELANISLAWMISMLEPLIDMSLDYVMVQDKENLRYYRDKGREPREWSFGKIYNSVTAAFTLGGTVTRTPGRYTRTNPENGEATNRPLRDTNEYVHASVRSRIVLRGPGYGDKGDYDPKSMKDFALRCEPDPAGMPTPWYWESSDSGGLTLPEAPLRKIERKLLSKSHRVEDYIFERPPPPPGRRFSKRASVPGPIRDDRPPSPPDGFGPLPIRSRRDSIRERPDGDGAFDNGPDRRRSRRYRSSRRDNDRYERSDRSESVERFERDVYEN